MKNKLFAFILVALTAFSCDDDFLEKPPLDALTDDTYWSSESNVRTFSYGFYSDYFTGYSSGYGIGRYWTGNNQVLSDDVAPTTPAIFTLNPPASGGGWTFSYVRKANIFIERVQDMSVLSTDAKAHWVGIGRFFRGLEYHDLVRRFGDVPYYDYVPETSDLPQLYKPRDSRTMVMDKVLEDFQYAAENVRLTDGAKGLTVNRDVVLAYMSRVFLFEGTWQKYHLNNTAKAQEYLNAAKWAANEVIASGRYSLGDYRDVFTSLDLSNNPEVIMFRQYEDGILQHSTQSLNNREAQSGASKDLIEAYVTKNGLPVRQPGNDQYQGDRGMENVVANRDPRLTETFVDSVRLLGMTYNGKPVYNYSSSGYVSHKFLNEANKTEPLGNNNLNVTDAPIIRYGEVLINYAEAAAELATLGGAALTQADLDKSVNVLRSRPGVGVAPLQVVGGLPYASGVQIEDPERDSSVPAMIWEIRRERRVELVFEGFRFDDLRRWKKLEYVDTEAKPEINRGAWVSRDHPDYKISAAIQLSPNETTPPSRTIREGYVVPSFAATGARIFNNDKYYLFPLPLNQINLYSSLGYELAQNPGWEQ
ncbi:RagB/SusD family nutrient uptake outer membrane protein [Rufibacter roseus]|uniref:RagB/SusD family nutrient uptake outer membrane protein n=1 Tax=Rufibacter roseus TaxID=1567108 RepID=A0ABW2DHL0_9BACT|nr:RagB/SusD family nutrient uptake outer membrane protein [Rufibacter roseus]